MTTLLEESLRQVLSCPRQQLGQTFYEDFLTTCPEAAPYFAGIPLPAQAKVLVNSLQAVVACHAHRYPAVENYLVVLGNRHHHRQIPVDLYPRFRDAMLRSLAAFHGDGWNAALASEWRAAFDTAIEIMSRGHIHELMPH